MKKNTEMLIYDMATKVRLYIASKVSPKKVSDLTDRECLILELIGMKGSMSISQIGSLCPSVSNSTISTTITRLWKEKKLVDKKIFPENQRVTTVSLTEKGEHVIAEIRRKQSDVLANMTSSLKLSSDQIDLFHRILENAIGFFDEALGLKFDNKNLN